MAISSNGRLRVALLTPSLYWGGAERWMLDLVRYSRDRIHWTGVAVWQPLNLDGTMVDLFREMIPVYTFGKDAIQEATQDADVVLSWGKCGLETLQGLDKPIVWVAHGCGEYDTQSLKEAKPIATHFACVSEACLPVMQKHGVHDATVLHNGIDTDRCRITKQRELVRYEIGFTENDFVVGYLGRMVPEKNLINLAKAIAIMPRKVKGCFVGDGWDIDNQRTQIRKVLGSRVVFVDRVEDIGNHLQAFDAFALVSPREGFAMSMLEAMWVGTPCILTRVGILPTLEAAGQKHWISIDAPASFGDIANAISRIMNMSPQERQAMVEGAKGMVTEHYTAKSMANRWVKYLSSVSGMVCHEVVESVGVG